MILSHGCTCVVNQTSSTTHIGRLSPPEFGSSPNKVFLKATDFVFILRADLWQQGEWLPAESTPVALSGVITSVQEVCPSRGAALSPTLTELRCV